MTSYISSVSVVLALVLLQAVNLCSSTSSSSFKLFVCLDIVIALVLSCLFVSF